MDIRSIHPLAADTPPLIGRHIPPRNESALRHLQVRRETDAGPLRVSTQELRFYPPALGNNWFLTNLDLPPTATADRNTIPAYELAPA